MKTGILLVMVLLSFPVLTHADDLAQAPPLAGQAVKQLGQSPVVSGGKGIIIKDRVTDQPFCVYIENGVLRSEPGNCGQ